MKKYIHSLVATLSFFLLSFFSLAHAEGYQSFSVGGTSGSIAPDGYATYNLQGACTAITGGCGNLTITGLGHNLLTNLNCSVSAGYTVNSCSSSGINITKSSFNGGDTYQITISGKADNLADGTVIPTTLTSVISSGPDGTPHTTTGSVTATVDDALSPPPIDGVWFTNASVQGATCHDQDENVLLNVEVCSSKRRGNADSQNTTMVATLPPGIDTIIDADGGVILDDTITWDLGSLSLNSLYSGQTNNSEQCVTKQIEISFPTAEYTTDGESFGIGVDSSGDSNGSAWSESDTVNVKLAEDCSTLYGGISPSDVAMINVGKQASSVSGNQFTYLFSLVHGQGSGAPIVNPTIVDLLPEGITFDGWTRDLRPSGLPGANLEVIDNYQGTGRQLIRFTWRQTPSATAFSYPSGPPASNPLSWDADDGAGAIYEEIRVNVNPIVPRGDLQNTVWALHQEESYNCPDGGRMESDASWVGYDINDDGDLSDRVCSASIDAPYISASGALSGTKYVKGEPTLFVVDDPGSLPDINDTECEGYPSGYTSHPCIAQTISNGNFSYLVEFTNEGNTPLHHYMLYDTLPKVGDVGVSPTGQSVPRLTEWQPTLTGPITFESANDFHNIPLIPNTTFTIEYTTAANPCNELNNPGNPSAGCNATYGPLPSDAATVTGFRIYGWHNGNDLSPGHTYRFLVPMRAPANAPMTPDPTDENNFHPAWNSFAHTADTDSDDYLLPAEPNKVGIIIKPGQDLAVIKTNDTSGQGIPGTPFQWIITVTSAGGDDIVFGDGQVILRDYLPASATYNNVNVSIQSGVTGGSIDCQLAANVLECTASGGSVTFDGSSANMAVTFDVTANTTGSLINPEGGICQVDPDEIQTELNETNNNCTDTVQITSTSTGSIRIVKDAQPDSNQAFAFTASGGSISPTSFALTDDGAGGTAEQLFSDLAADTYTFTETVPSNWQLTNRSCVDAGGIMTSTVTNTTDGIEITLVAGENITCTFTNEEILGGQECSLTASISVSACSNTPTDSDPSNDTFELSVRVDGTNTGSSSTYTYRSSSGNITGSGTYGNSETDGPFVISATTSPFDIVVADDVDSTCMLTLSSGFNAPATCSSSTSSAIDLSLNKTVNPSSNVQRGDTVVYTITLSNISDVDATGVVVSDSLPPEVRYISNNSGGSATENSGTVTWTVGDVPAQSSLSLEITVVIN